MSRPQYDPDMPVLNPEALKSEDEDPDSLYDKWWALAQANPDPNIDDPSRECPLFMSEIPEDPALISENPALAAIQNIVHVEQTPQEIAEQFRDRGNEALQTATGIVGWKTARGLYTDGLRQEGVTPELRRILFANRAQVQLNLGNYGHCIQDCIQSLKLQPSIKAYFRCIQASNKLEKWQMTLEMCEQALQLEGITAAQTTLVTRHLDAARAALVAREEQERARCEAEKERSLPHTRVYSAMQQRGLRTGPPEYSSDQMATYTGDKQLTYCEEDGELHFPLLFVYDEYGTSDFVHDAPESSCLRQTLDTMFPPGAPRPPWDTAGAYDVASIACFFFWDHRQTGRSEGYVEIDVAKPLRDVLNQSDFYIPVPSLILTFHIVPCASELARRWRQGS